MIVSIIRKEARQKLKGKWKKALLLMLLFFVLTIILNFISYWFATNATYGILIGVINLIINGVLNYGVITSFIKIKRNEEVNLFNFIYYSVKDFEKVLKVVAKTLLNVSGYIILVLFFLYLMITEFVSLYNGYGMRLTYVIEILGVMGFSILLTMKSLNYSLNYYILYDNSTYKAKEILKESERLMKSHRWDFLKMNLSFAGWFLLGVLFCAIIITILFLCKVTNILIFSYISYIPLIFIMPYMNVTTICFYDNLLFNNQKNETKYTEKNKNKKKK